MISQHHLSYFSGLNFVLVREYLVRLAFESLNASLLRASWLIPNTKQQSCLVRPDPGKKLSRVLGRTSFLAFSACLRMRYLGPGRNAGIAQWVFAKLDSLVIWYDKGKIAFLADHAGIGLGTGILKIYIAVFTDLIRVFFSSWKKNHSLICIHLLL